MRRDTTESLWHCTCGATFMNADAAMDHELKCLEPHECENCRTTEEGCTDNYHPELGWCCGDCRDAQEWEDNQEYEG